ncbi:hypothetical protein G4B88_006819 [Cannabis sativa]|uniref:Zinc knuckle CX2CX4HX4C domain-containing protein n=1 Tax=Cannabis sativa TaxID=3483 RepID=A0A7J6E1E4_CANSA|nr:hypothetical protein G4B88_006819 [Cannabis sativa]
MESIIVSKSTLKGKCFSCLETSVKLSPCDTSLKALASCCLFGKIIAPMVLDDMTMTDFVAKNWKIPVSVVTLEDEEKQTNVFKFGFECADHRDWALLNGLWCIRGYTLVLQAWSPTFDGPTAFKLLLVQVEIDEGKPASWRKFLRVQVDIQVDKPLFLGCFFDLASGVKKWVQMKYEKIGIFCYFCGCLGHQRRGCSLSTPVTVANLDDILFPMYGPWLSVLSAYQSVFSGPVPSTSRSSSSATGRKISGAVMLTPATTGEGENGSTGGLSNLSRRQSQPVKRTAHAAEGPGKSHRAVWFPKRRPIGAENTVAISGFGGEKEDLGVRKEAELLPVLTSNSRVIGLNDGHLNFMTVTEKPVEGGPGVVGPCGALMKKAGVYEDSGYGPTNLVSNNKRDADNGPQVVSSKKNSGGPALEGNLAKAIPKNGLVGPCNLDIGSISNGPVSLAQDQIGLVNANLSTNLHEAQEHLNEDIALAQFFNAQESLLHDLKHFGKLDLYEIRSIGGDIGVPASSEVNERTTPFKKRKFEASASLCSRPHKVPRKYPDVSLRKTAQAPRVAREF